MENLLEFLKLFDKNPEVFTVLYKEKIVFMNNAFAKKIGLKDYKDIYIWDLIANKKQKEAIKKNVLKRVKGEVYSTYYENVEIFTYNNKRLYTNFFSKTIKIDEEYYGLSIGFDSTSFYIKSVLIEILKDINELAISKNFEEDIFEELVKIIYKKGFFKFVYACVKDKAFKRKVFTSSDEDFFYKLQKILCSSSFYCWVKELLDLNEMVVINDINEISKKKDLHALLSENGVKSMLFLPIFKHKKLYSIIAIASRYVNDFTPQMIEIFKSLKKDIEYALEKIEKITHLEILKNAFDNTYAWVVITDEDANIIYANKAVERISKYKIKELIGQNPRIFKSGYHSKEFYKKMWDNLINNKPVEALIINKNKNGKLFYLKDKIIPIKTSTGRKYYMSLAIDVTHEYRLKNKLKYDVITDLLNRNEFIIKAGRYLKKVDKAALIVIDISDFKIYNQVYGSECGDYLLREFAKFLKHFFYEDDLIARIGGDEFAILCKVDNYLDIEHLVNRLVEKLKHNSDFKNKFAVNIGVALYPKDDTDIVKLLEKAIYALEMAKEKGDFAYEFFDKIYDSKIIEYFDVKRLILEAIDKKQFIYFFQPYVDSKTYKIMGAETLLRIKKGNEIIPPNVFIDFLENSNYIKEVEKIMFPKYVEYLKKAKIPLSFNISGRSLLDFDHIRKLFEKVSDDMKVVIELTEREIALNIDYTKKVFDYLKSKGFKLSIDDFGTGYSSLTYLKDLPADFLKIDMSFIKNIETSKKDLAIVETIIHFAHNFGLKTIAEGVENERQIKILAELNCDYLQGFYFYKPMPFEEFIEVVEKN